ncbi:unnamed protein product [Caenorhabditis bovis]|uniref:VWFA domain-containing protein n=1 Tax=Caenorhabditis bovis TaxID=2654633 RepID=A0A8S1EI41_9PELO|nr:unnamed protein product [Caenorhabditis bovis]
MRDAIVTSRLSTSSVGAKSNDVPITIVGISDGGNGANVLYALSYTDRSKPSLDELKTDISESPNFDFIAATDKTAPKLDELECLVTSDLFTTTSFSTIISTTSPFVKPSEQPNTGKTSQPASPETSTNVPFVSTVTSIISSNVPTQSPSSTLETTSAKTDLYFERDVIILLDSSTSVLNANNFNTVKKWITNSLIPNWKIDQNNVQVAFGTYSTDYFEAILSFDENSQEEVVEVINGTQYYGKTLPSITNGIRSALTFNSHRNVNITTILISSSQDLEDIETALQFSRTLSSYPNQLVTVNVKASDNGQELGFLSTGQSHFFASSNFVLTDDIAKSITNYMFEDETTTIKPTTVTPIPDNTCKTDQIQFLQMLIKSWSISPETTEGQAILYSSTDGGMIIENAFNYQSASAFANELLSYDDYYFAMSDQSISGSLEYLSENLGNRRSERLQTTILVTYSSSNDDVEQAIHYYNIVGGNLIVLGMRDANQEILSALSENIVVAQNYTTDLIDKINSLICTFVTRTRYDTTKKFIDQLNFNDVENHEDFNTLVSTITPFLDFPVLKSAYELAIRISNPIRDFGSMSTVIFTSGSSDADFNTISNLYHKLKAKGQVIIVVMNSGEDAPYKNISDSVFLWPDTTLYEQIAKDLNQQLNNV